MQCAVKFVLEHPAMSHTKIMKHLRKYFLNAPNNVFGDQSHCSSYFCNCARHKNEKNLISDMKTSGLYQDMMVVLDRVARNAESLIFNMDNNAAECYNSIVAKFVGGKRINFSGKGSYQTRCEAASLAYNAGTGQITRYIHKKSVGFSPGKYTKIFMASMEKRRKWKSARKALFPKRKKCSIAEPADSDYGAVQEEEELTSEEYETK